MGEGLACSAQPVSLLTELPIDEPALQSASTALSPGSHLAGHVNHIFPGQEQILMF